MTDETRSDGRSLEPILSRLREIERKCSAMGSRNDEFPLMQERIASLINRLEAAARDPDQQTGLGDMARELFAVAHLFESLGFMSVGREIAHIERALHALDPSPAAADASRPAAAPQPSSPDAPDGVTSNQRLPAPPGPSEDYEAPRPAPAPVIIGFAVLALAVLAAASIILRIGPLGGLFRGEAVVERHAATPEPAPTPPPTPRAVVAPTATHPPTREIERRSQFADALSQARLALARRQLDAVAERLSEAARFDRTDDDVMEIADGLLAAYVVEAEGAAAAGDWTLAADHLQRADRIALRFGLDDGSVRALERRIAAMEKFTWVTPDQRTTIDQLVGRRVEVHLRSGDVYRGNIAAIEGSTLLVEMVREVAGGGLTYLEEIPLPDVARVKVFEP